SAPPRPRIPASPHPRPATSPLFVCGSLNPRSREQVERLEAAPIDAAAPSALDQAVALLRRSEPAVLSSASWPASATAEQIATALGRLVAEIATRARPDALLLTGGDTARAVLAAVDAHGVELDDELLPGLPVGRVVGGGLADIRVITKAGGF